MFFKKKSLVESDKNARALLASAEKVFNYRCDLFSENERARIEEDVSALRSARTPDALKAASARLTETLRELGGTIFPQGIPAEFTDLVVVAAILVFGIRAFFFQPFKIPTNSMYPTYNGMTSAVCAEPLPEWRKWTERIFRSASFYEFSAPESGEIAVSFSRAERVGSSDFFEMLVGDSVLRLELPRDFSIDSVLLEKFFPDEFAKKELSLAERRNNVLRRVSAGALGRAMRGERVFIKTGIRVNAGEKFLSFRIFGGDMVLVNRFAYHFTRPRAGDPFVFRTHNIPGLGNVELYYIKRLAGTPGDKLVVSDKKLFRNGELASSADAFSKNNSRDFANEYFGYLPAAGGNGLFSMPLHKPITVPEGFYYALGDNSSNSFDSRGWGCVPVADVVGKAAFVLYPFSRNWGIAE